MCIGYRAVMDGKVRGIGLILDLCNSSEYSPFGIISNKETVQIYSKEGRKKSTTLNAIASSWVFVHRGISLGVWYSLWVRVVPGSNPGFPLPFLFFPAFALQYFQKDGKIFTCITFPTKSVGNLCFNDVIYRIPFQLNFTYFDILHLSQTVALGVGL